MFYNATPYTVGYESLIEKINAISSQSLQTFPKYNLYRKDENSEEYYVDLALAGYSKSELKITTQNQYLIIEGSKEKQEENYFYQHQGIASRSFKKTIMLEEHVFVAEAKFKNGVLSIMLKREVPEERKQKTIAIN
jgi:molecular chaperone IbpA